MRTSIDKYKEAMDKIAKAKEETKKLVKEAFAESTKDIFDKFPQVKTFSFTMYTPHFCDGDPCVFGVQHYDEAIEINGQSMDDLYDSDDESKNKEISSICKEISLRLQIFSDEDYQDMFGDGVKVIVSREKIEIEDYDHD